jgi:hypothetical protein
MNRGKRQILILVEGAKTDIRLMQHLLNIYGISERHNIIPYNTNIYVLYESMFKKSNPNDLDIMQHLKEHEPDSAKRALLEERFTDILLIFDLDPQDPSFSERKISEMQEYFCESSDMGKLYINYPMVESFFHMKSIPDAEYNNYTVSLDELRAGTYKARVNAENRNRDYSKYAVNKNECDLVISQNIEKAWLLIGTVDKLCKVQPPNASYVLKSQLDMISTKRAVAVLCTCSFYITDYNPKLID